MCTLEDSKWQHIFPGFIAIDPNALKNSYKKTLGNIPVLDIFSSTY